MKRPTNARAVAETLEDAAFLASQRVGLTETAHRLGFPGPDALEKWLARRTEHALVARLRSCDPLPLERSA